MEQNPNAPEFEQKERNHGLFSHTAAPEPPAPNGGIDRIAELATRLRLNEQRTGELRKQLSFVEQNMISNHRAAMSQIKTAQEDLVRIKQRIQNIEDTLLKITKEFRMVARKEDVDIIKRYVDLWDPVKFVTLDQVERMINEKIVAHNKSETPGRRTPSTQASDTLPAQPTVSSNTSKPQADQDTSAQGEETQEDQDFADENDEPTETENSFESLVKKHNV